MIIRTPEEIVNYLDYLIKEEEEDFFGFQSSDILDWLQWDSAKLFLKDELQEEAEKTWKVTEETPEETIISYLPFAWEKANDCRGLSSCRSIEHFLAWTWLCDDDFYNKLKEARHMRHGYYGKPLLVMVSEHYGFDWKEHDDNRWTNEEGKKGITAKLALQKINNKEV